MNTISEQQTEVLIALKIFENECREQTNQHISPSRSAAVRSSLIILKSILCHILRANHYCTMTNDRHVYVRDWRTVARQLFAPDGACAMLFFFNMCMKR